MLRLLDFAMSILAYHLRTQSSPGCAGHEPAVAGAMADRVTTTHTEVVADGAELRQNSTCPAKLAASAMYTSASSLARA